MLNRKVKSIYRMFMLYVYIKKNSEKSSILSINLFNRNEIVLFNPKKIYVSKEKKSIFNIFSILHQLSGLIYPTLSR